MAITDLAGVDEQRVEVESRRRDLSQNIKANNLPINFTYYVKGLVSGDLVSLNSELIPTRLHKF